MKKLLILSGKGGTGKTTAAAAFIEFNEIKAFADCDVDAPNLHLVLDIKDNFEKKDYMGSQKAFIDPSLCKNCGLCQKYCRFDAIKKDGAQYKIDLFACEGCAVCEYICPINAITMKDDIAGDLLLYRKDKTFSTAKLKMGRGTSGKLVTEVKNALDDNAKEYKLAIIDGSPGIGCPVIASISGVDLVLVVAEPSLSGISDMKRILKTSNILGTKAVVCVNKSDVCPENTLEIKRYCNENNIPYMGNIPYDSSVSRSINQGISIAKVDCPARNALQHVFEKVMDQMNTKNE